MTPLTDDRGKALLPADDMVEPHRDSVVLVDGPHGTAWQRHRDGVWRSTAGGHAPWAVLVRKPRLILLYDAPARERVNG